MTEELFKGKSIRDWLLAFFGLALFAIPMVAIIGADSGQTTTTDEYWPGAEWRTSTPEEQGMDSSYIRSMIESIQAQQKEIHSLLIIRNGYLVTEVYFHPYRKGIRHIIYSSTKSFTSALIGIAINEGYIKSINDKVLKFFPDLKIANLDKRKKALTVEHLLKMATGFDWDEAGEKGNISSINQMMNSKDPVQFLLDRKMIGEPGKSFYYNTGASHLLTAILQRATGKNALTYGREKLFGPMGISDIYWSSDRKGIMEGGSGLYLKPADIAKFGYLFLKKGKWGDKQLVPEKWVQESTRKQIEVPGSQGGYGYQWWTDPVGGGYSAIGVGGQDIIVMPELNSVVVFTSGLSATDSLLPFTLTFKYIIPSLMKSGNPFVKNPASEAALNQIITAAGQAPKPKPVPQLPGICNAISGKQYRMDGPIICNDVSGKQYRMDGSSALFFQFGKNPNECIFQELVNGTKYEVQIGLDDVYRINRMDQLLPVQLFPGVSQLAAKGRWVNNTTFEINFQNLFDCDEIKATFSFKNDTVFFEVVSKMFNYTISKGKGVLQL